MKVKIKAILFDLVGTLIYIKDPVGYVYSNVAHLFGFETNYEKLDKAFEEVCRGLSLQASLGSKTEEKKWWRNIVLKTFSLAGYNLEDKFDDIFEELFKIFSQKSAWVIYPDVIPMLKTCRSKSLQLGIISNFDSRLEIILKEIDLQKYFQCLAYSGKVGFSKPDPQIFQYALNELNVLPEEALYVGDSLNIDYYPACDLNINSVLIDREKNCSKSLLQQAQGIETISNLNQIFDYL